MIQGDVFFELAPAIVIGLLLFFDGLDRRLRFTQTRVERREFLRMLRDRRVLPSWERPNMLARYYVTTTGTELSHESPVKVAPRIAPE